MKYIKKDFLRHSSSNNITLSFSNSEAEQSTREAPILNMTMIWPLLLLFQLCIARPFHSTPNIRPLSQFANESWVENIAVRSNGQLLVTLFTSPDLYQIDPFQKDPTPRLVATFPETIGTLGIVEIEDDVFAITKGNVSLATATITPKSFSVWKADFQHKDTPVLSKITNLPNAIFLNGITTVKKGSKFLLTADSLGGVIWRVNIETSEYDLMLNDTTTQPTGPLVEGGFGVNGVHTKDGFLYFTNSNRGFFRVPIHEDGTQAGAVEAITDFAPSDDFTFDKKGDAYVSRGAVDLIVKVTPTGTVTPLAYKNTDASVLIEGNTAVQFGRTERDCSTLYVTTNGGQTGLVNGTSVQGGRVLAIDFRGSRSCSE